MQDEYISELFAVKVNTALVSNIIDKFVDFLITENCEGCGECEPRLSEAWSNVCCVEAGKAKWLLEQANRFKEMVKNERQ